MRQKLPDTFEEVESRLYSILLRSKLGQPTTQEEDAFAEQCWKKWPQEYGTLQRGKVEEEAFRRVNPLA